MYEELYAPIPDVGAYLERLGVPYREQRSREYLDELIYAHQCRIAFDNSDSYPVQKDISLSIADIYEKIIIDRRGGYCFELNGLFTGLLVELGYAATSCLVRIVRGRDYLPATLHRAILVRIEESLYYCDVGYGGPCPAGSLEVAADNREMIRGEEFYIRRYNEDWWILGRITSEGEAQDIFQFYTMPQDNVTFLPINYYCSHSPDSVFTRKPFYNRRLPDGTCGIVGNTFTLRQDGHLTTIQITTQQQLQDLVTKYFTD